MELIIDFLSFKIPVVLESLITPLVNCRGDMIVSAVKHQCPWIKKLFFLFHFFRNSTNWKGFGRGGTHFW